MLKSKWTQFFIALLIGAAIGGFFVLKTKDPVGVPKRLSLPDLKLYNNQGELAASLYEYRSKTLLVSFWASWCEPCKKEIPELVKLKEQFADKDFEVILINEDDEPELGEEFLKNLAVDTSKLLSFYDNEFQTAESIGVESLPSTYLVDKNSKEVFSAVGYMDWLSGPAFEMLKELLAE